MAEGYAKKTNWEEKLMDEVKKLLGDELFKQVEEKIGDVKIDIVSDGKKWIPKVKFDEINTDKNTYKKQAENLTKDLDKLKVEQLLFLIMSILWILSSIRLQHFLKDQLLPLNLKTLI